MSPELKVFVVAVAVEIGDGISGNGEKMVKACALCIPATNEETAEVQAINEVQTTFKAMYGLMPGERYTILHYSAAEVPKDWMENFLKYG